MTDTVEQIRDAVLRHDTMSTLSAIANETGVPESVARGALILLAVSGEVRRLDSELPDGTPLVMWGKP